MNNKKSRMGIGMVLVGFVLLCYVGLIYVPSVIVDEPVESVVITEYQEPMVKTIHRDCYNTEIKSMVECS